MLMNRSALNDFEFVVEDVGGELNRSAGSGVVGQSRGVERLVRCVHQTRREFVAVARLQILASLNKKRAYCANLNKYSYSLRRFFGTVCCKRFRFSGEGSAMSAANDSSTDLKPMSYTALPHAS